MSAIDNVGFVSPILVQAGGSDMIIDGHLRAELAERSGVAEVDILYLDVTDDEANMLLTVFDKITDMAAISQDKLDELLNALPDTDAVREMLNAVDITWGSGGRINMSDAAADPDEIPLPAVATLAQVGDVWRLGEHHRLGVGDASDAALVRAVTNGRLHDVCWTDPPYGVSYIGKTKDALTIENDNDPVALRKLIDEVFQRIEEVTKPGSPVYVAHPAGPLSLVFGEAILDAGWRWHQTLVWVKDSMVLGHSDYHYRHEPIYLAYTPGGEGRRGRGGANWYGNDSQTTVFEVPRPKASRDHPTMKPTALMADMLANSCPPHGYVFEPFGGSGQTMFACETLGMRCSIIELDPVYADVIIRRWEAYYGVPAERESNIYGEPAKD